MAKFIYKMQSILNIKEKLKEQARNEFAAAKIALDEENDALLAIKNRKAEYEEQGRALRSDAINIRDLADNKYALERMDEYIRLQEQRVIKAEKNLERAREKLTLAMQEAEVQNRLREKAFEEFKKELIAQESKEVDELTSYTYGQRAMKES